MKNKFLVLLFALVMILGVVGCSKKANDNANTNEQTTQEDTADKVVDENYYNVYTKNYESSIVPLEESYYIYGNVDSAEKYYKDHDYPGNKEYLNEVKAALVDSKEKVQEFIDNMEKDGKSDNEKVNKLNKEMIDDGKDLIEDIDKRLEKLDKITDKDLAKSDKEFRRIVGDHIVLEKEGDHDFKEILKKLDKELNIERKDKNR
ncbi:hypothetical protein [Intestinibacter bartlettii]|uniref:Lipoprotein n=1 Tax=Intestinibacter bartlettii TaxID=261299 RepID=A0ABS8CWB4_9FIRM|nr:hypothetical protein [Intestinibacter bartlettii]SCI56770.1 Uncharacterised protein [uncultured Clostridium sp.]MCB5396953.1 hypothetical protein [Intestinibacter bartlettii]MCB5403502.1 hypothetical protein [Intestinibacter bartlettii]MCB5445759.1 hypothetical protein [Intestinibacter bartlettii]MCB5719422.1 hypothetical protein [Intestinibacter bartlettii]